jgi:hypothetical protein
MSLVRKLKKFSIIPALVLAPFLVKAQDIKTYNETQSIGQWALSQNIGEVYRKEILFKNLIKDLQFEAGFSVTTPQNSEIRYNFPAQYGAEFSVNKKITPNLKANAFFTAFKGENNQEIQRDLIGSTIGLGIEYHKFIDFGIGLIKKEQRITGPQNGFPNKLEGLGFYVQTKKEFSIIPNFLYGYFKFRTNQVKEIGHNELTLGLILKPQQSTNTR